MTPFGLGNSYLVTTNQTELIRGSFKISLIGLEAYPSGNRVDYEFQGLSPI